MITNVTSTTDTAAADAAMKKSLGMNKDDFMKLFIAQLQYQDPLETSGPERDAGSALPDVSGGTVV